MWNRIDVKARGKAAFKANFWKCVLAAFILTLVAGGINTANSASETSQQVQSVTDQYYSYNYNYQQPDVSVNAAGAVGGMGLLLLAAKVLLFNPLTVGGYRFFLKNNEEGHAEIDEFLFAFKEGRWGNIVTVMLVRDIYLFLWTLLFIIPGIVKSYSYRMVPYILSDNPTLGPNEAITASRQLMDGEKGDTFVLDLSFIGWFLLGTLTLGILFIFYVNPYYYSAHAEQYRAMTRDNEMLNE